MPRPPIARGWREAISSIVANPPLNERLTDQAIVRRLKDVAPRIGRTDVPSARSVGRIRKEFLEQPEEVRREYYRFHWPESMEDGSLPWDASAAGLELIRADENVRPPLRLVKWFWRISTTAPDAPYSYRRGMAGILAAAEIIGALTPDVYRAIESATVYEPWRSGEAAREYERAVLAGRAGEVRLEFKPGNQTTASEATIALLGPDIGEIAPIVRMLLEDDGAVYFEDSFDDAVWANLGGFEDNDKRSTQEGGSA